MTDVSKTDQGNKEEPIDLLLRQVKNKVDLEGKGTKATDGAAFSELFQFASGAERTKIYLGWFFACLTGAILPAFFFLIGDVFDSFIPEGDQSP